MSKSKQQTQVVKCHRDGMEWGEYVTAGQTYTVTNNPANKRSDFYFRRADGAGTMMRPWQFARAVKAGWIEVVAS